MTTISQRLSLPHQALLFDWEQLYRCFQTVPDPRKRRGRRYRLAALLLIGVLAKWAGQESSRAMAHWARLRKDELSRLFPLKRQTMPHYSSWSRMLGQAVKPEEVEQALSQFFADQKRSKSPKRGSIQVCLDGKTLRGPIPAGHSHGVHLRAAASFGAELALLFQPRQSRPGWSAVPMDVRSATTWNTGHGRLEKRTISVSRRLSGSSDFPSLAQVFRLESRVRPTGGRSRHEIRSGLDLPARFGRLTRTAPGARAWAVGNRAWPARSTGDDGCRQDHAQLRMGYAPHLLAILNNAVVGLVARQGSTNLAEARREFAYQRERALAAPAA
jgi:hypothetical protein